MSVERDMPAPLVLGPSASHKATIILLHGRGRKASVFASEMASLQQALPHAKLIFPWAPKERATVYKKSITRQWFDDWHLSPDLQSNDVVHSRYDEGLQTSGLGETVAYLHELICEEARGVGGAQNVVIGGFSQGAAASLSAALLWDGEQKLGGVVAICAWLPYVSQMAELLQRGGGDETPCSAQAEQQHEEDDFDPFERTPYTENEADRDIDSFQAVLEWLREQIELPQAWISRRDRGHSQTPIMFCHGSNDDKVTSEQNQKASDFLSGLSIDSVERRAYPGLGHEISSNMVADIVVFLQSAVGGNTAQAFVSPSPAGQYLAGS